MQKDPPDPELQELPGSFPPTSHLSSVYTKSCTGISCASAPLLASPPARSPGERHKVLRFGYCGRILAVQGCVCPCVGSHTSVRAHPCQSVHASVRLQAACVRPCAVSVRVSGVCGSVFVSVGGPCPWVPVVHPAAGSLCPGLMCACTAGAVPVDPRGSPHSGIPTTPHPALTGGRRAVRLPPGPGPGPLPRGRRALGSAAAAGAMERREAAGSRFSAPGSPLAAAGTPGRGAGGRRVPPGPGSRPGRGPTGGGARGWRGGAGGTRTGPPQPRSGARAPAGPVLGRGKVAIASRGFSGLRARLSQTGPGSLPRLPPGPFSAFPCRDRQPGTPAQDGTPHCPRDAQSPGPGSLLPLPRHRPPQTPFLPARPAWACGIFPLPAARAQESLAVGIKTLPQVNFGSRGVCCRPRRPAAFRALSSGSLSSGRARRGRSLCKEPALSTALCFSSSELAKKIHTDRSVNPKDFGAACLHPHPHIPNLITASPFSPSSLYPHRCILILILISASHIPILIPESPPSSPHPHPHGAESSVPWL